MKNIIADDYPDTSTDNSKKDCTHKNYNTLNLPPSSTTYNGLIKEVNFVNAKCTSEPSLNKTDDNQKESPLMASSPSKLTLISPEDQEFPERKLSRGISRAANNFNLVSKARSEFAQDFRTSSRGSRLLNIDGFLETPDFTFTLPDIEVYETEFKDFLKKDLIEKSTLNSLQSAKRLNWWSEICQNLYPLVTSGDGNCLLHAASLGTCSHVSLFSNTN